MELVEIMGKKHLSKNALAISANIHAYQFSQALAGKKPFLPEWRERIAKALGVPVEEIEFKTTKPKNKQDEGNAAILNEIYDLKNDIQVIQKQFQKIQTMLEKGLSKESDG